MFVLIPNPIANVDSSLWIRWQLQKAAVVESDVLGHGLGTSASVIRRSTINTGGIYDPHSWYGVILIDTGYIGLVLFLIFYGGILVGLLRTNNPQDSIQTISIISLIALPVAGLGPSNVVSMPMFWIVLGLAVVKLQSARDPSNTADS
jgi:O-antigen ligase